MFGSSLAAGAAAYGALRLANKVVALDTLPSVLLQGAFAFFIGSMAYLLILYLFKNKETLELVGIIKQRAGILKVFLGETGREGIK